jgi:hypothetical protein
MSTTNVGLAVIETLVAQDLNVGVGQVEVTHPAGGTQVGDQINLSSLSLYLKTTWSPIFLSPGSFQSQAFTVAGARPGDMVLASFDPDSYSQADSLQIFAKVALDDQVNVVMKNISDVITATPGAGTLRIMVFRLP